MSSFAEMRRELLHVRFSCGGPPISEVVCDSLPIGERGRTSFSGTFLARNLISTRLSPGRLHIFLTAFAVKQRVKKRGKKEVLDRSQDRLQRKDGDKAGIGTNISRWLA